MTAPLLLLALACSGEDPVDDTADTDVTDTDDTDDTDTPDTGDPPVPTADTGTPAAQADLVIRNATIFPATGDPAFVGTVVVVGDRIEEIVAGDALDWTGTSELDATGQTLVPGFVHLLTHMSVRSHVDADPLAHIDPVRALATTMEERLVTLAGDPKARLALYEQTLRTSLRGGVTTFVDSISSLDDVDAVRALTAPDLPDFYSLGPILSPPGHHPPALDGTDLKYELPISRPFVDWQADLETDLQTWFTKHGVAGVKVAVDSTEPGAAGQVPPEVIEAICDVAHANGGPCFFLSYTDQGMVDAANAGADVKLGPPQVITRFGIRDAAGPTWDALVAADVGLLTLSSTFSNMERYVADPKALAAEPLSSWPTLPQETRDNYDALTAAFSPFVGQAPVWTNPLSAYFHGGVQFADASTVALLDARGRGLRFLPATSPGSPWVFHGTFGHELELLAGASIPVDEVLEAATIEGARVMGLDAEIGSIEVGKRADLVLLGGDPWTDPAALSDIETVVRAGFVVTP